jgi:hypothetical protein
MADLQAGLGPDRGKVTLWRRLKEERFTNVDLLVVLGALVITGVVGALSGALLLG